MAILGGVMKVPENHKFHLTLTQKMLQRLGLTFCKCSHRPNNHFDHGTNPCAHCDCKEYDQQPIVGEVK